MAASKEAALFEALLQTVCREHGLARTDFLQAERDARTMRLCLQFKAPRYDQALMDMARAVLNISDDELRGEMVRAAVPQFSEAAIKLATAIVNPKPRVVMIDPEAYDYRKMFP